MKLAFGEGVTSNSPWVATLAQDLGFEFFEVDTSTSQSLEASIDDADALIVALHKLTAEKIAALPETVRCIGRLGVGLDNIDLAAAESRRLPVIFQPTYAFNEVANHALAMIMALHRGIFQGHNGILRGEWIPAPKVAAITSLQDATLGVIGCGRIGQSLIEKATPLFKRIVGFDPGIKSLPNVEMMSSLEEVLQISEVVTLHAPYMKSTHHLISKERLAIMPKGSILVNVSRGGLIDEAALAESLHSGHLDGAGLDVFESEPLQAESPLRQAPNLLMTPHIAWYSQSAGPRLMEWSVRDVLGHLSGSTSVNGKYAVGPF